MSGSAIINYYVLQWGEDFSQLKQEHVLKRLLQGGDHEEFDMD